MSKLECKHGRGCTANSLHITPKSVLRPNKLMSSLIFTVPNLLNCRECWNLIRYAEDLGFLHQGSRGPARGEAFRDNGRISVQDANLAEKLWASGIAELFRDIKIDGKLALGLNPNIRFYRYKEGQRFGPHIDESIELGEGRITKYTLLIYLNGVGNSQGKKSNEKSDNPVLQLLQGGETVFYTWQKTLIEVAPVAGMALLHLHGEQCLLHEAHVVSKGVKYILRSDVIFS